MRHVILTALITCLAVGTAAAQSCDSQAVSANGKPLHGAATLCRSTRLHSASRLGPISPQVCANYFRAAALYDRDQQFDAQ